MIIYLLPVCLTTGDKLPAEPVSFIGLLDCLWPACRVSELIVREHLVTRRIKFCGVRMSSNQSCAQLGRRRIETQLQAGRSQHELTHLEDVGLHVLDLSREPVMIPLLYVEIFVGLCPRTNASVVSPI